MPQTGNQECLIEISLGTPPQLLIASDDLFGMGLVSPVTSWSPSKNLETLNAIFIVVVQKSGLCFPKTVFRELLSS